jgi:hypothetical protein
MNVQCQKCHALHWDAEKLTRSTQSNIIFGMCCLDGKVQLPLPQQAPLGIQKLFDGQDPNSDYFLKKVRRHNFMFAFTSLGNTDCSIRQGGPYVFKIRGELYHRIGAFLPPEGETEQFAQIYIIDQEAATAARVSNNSDLQYQPDIIHRVNNDLQNHNQYVRLFKHAYERLKAEESQGAIDLQVCLRVDLTSDRRRYNLPKSNTELAVAMPGTGEPNRGRDIILKLCSNGGYQRISETHPAYLALHYVLLFPHGEFGWQKNIPHRGVNIPQVTVHNQINEFENPEIDNDDEDVDRGQQNIVTQREFYAHMLHHRVINHDHNIFLARDLFQQFIVDAWAQIEQSRLNFIKFNQTKFRSEVASTIVDTLPNEYNNNRLAEIGKKVVLPSSFSGGERQMFQLYQDSMAIACFCGRVDFFLTFTVNPGWKEITDELLPGQKSSDRPDLISRVFHMKVNSLMKDIKEGLFGLVKAHIYTVEYQKRGLPHVHILIFMDPNSRPQNPDDVDEIIRAEFPDPETEPELFDCVMKYMLHGSCDQHCIDQRTKKYSKGYPKPFRETTTFTEDSYVSYRRRNNGRVYIKINSRGQEIRYDNSNVVPYCPYILKKYEGHSNQECAMSIKSVKYIHKYVYKGPDRATIETHQDQVQNAGAQALIGDNNNNAQRPVDEVKKYIDARYVSSSEAVWRIFHYTCASRIKISRCRRPKKGSNLILKC